MPAGIKYCPKCGSIMYPRKKDDVIELFCTRCGYTMPADESVKKAYRIRSRVERSPKDKIIVVSSDSVPPTASIIKGDTRCPKCGYEELYYWVMQTRAADEPPTRFYKCRRCGYTWREYA